MGWGYGMGFGLMETLFPVFFVVIFVIIIGMFIATAVQGASRWRRNNHSPVLTVEAQAVAKRTDVHHRRHSGTSGMAHSHTTTRYYATFQVESGDRMELEVAGEEYGLLVEGDRGKLTFQGTRYLGFVRTADGNEFH